MRLCQFNHISSSNQDFHCNAKGTWKLTELYLICEWILIYCMTQFVCFRCCELPLQAAVTTAALVAVAPVASIMWRTLPTAAVVAIAVPSPPPTPPSPPSTGPPCLPTTNSNRWRERPPCNNSNRLQCTDRLCISSLPSLSLLNPARSLWVFIAIYSINWFIVSNDFLY